MPSLRALVTFAVDADADDANIVKISFSHTIRL
jgi:hypothetical protein